MCGIAGIVSTAIADVAVVNEMCDRMRLRGPDGHGTWVSGDRACALGHRRLAVLDLSAAADQPMADASGTLQIVHNGEIYNCRELRAELEGRGHRFRTTTDTEVVLAAYREWGRDALDRLEGMWAFAIWDDTAKRLFCSRDRFGIKPLYYCARGGTLWFASDLGALVATQRSVVPNDRRVVDFLRSRLRDHTDETMFRDVFQLPAAHWLEWNAGQVRTERYWELRPQADAPRTFGDAAAAVRSELARSVKAHLLADVEVGACLSGGVDSGGIVSIAAKDHDVRLTTFSTCYREPEANEEAYIDLVVGDAGVKNHKARPTGADVLEALPDVLAAHAEPFASTAIVSQYFTYRLVREHGVKVTINGQGADELFAGYLGYYGPLLRTYIRRWRAVALAREGLALWREHRDAAYRLLPGLPFRRRRAPAAGHVLGDYPILRSDFLGTLGEDGEDDTPGFDEYRSAMVARYSLPAVLHYEDVNSMAWSVESRVPFLDHRLAELAIALPPDYLMRGGLTKRVAREALAGVLVDDVRLRRDKMGYTTPEARWLRGELRPVVEEGIRASRDYPYFAADGVLDLWDAFQRQAVGGYAAATLWRVFNTVTWLRTHF